MKFMQAKRGSQEAWQRHEEDVDRLAVIACRHGAMIPRDDLRYAWEAYSDSMAAGWMGLDDDDEVVWDRLAAYLEDA